MCDSCNEKDEVIVALQHVIRELRHDLALALMEVRLAFTNLFKGEEEAA